MPQLPRRNGIHGAVREGTRRPGVGRSDVDVRTLRRHATGGAGRIFQASTNAYANTGDGLGLAARAGVKLNESTVRPLDATLVKVTGAAEPSGIPIVTAQAAKGDSSGRSGGYRGSRSKGGGKKKKSRPRPHERRKRPR